MVKSPITHVEFDASNPHHRKIVGQYISTGSWYGNIRFTLDDQRWNNIPAMVTNELIKYYVKNDAALNEPSIN